MNDEQLDLAIWIFSFGLGGIQIGALTLSRTRAQVALAITLTLVCYALIHSDEQAPNMFNKNDLIDFLIYTAIAMATLGSGNLLWGSSLQGISKLLTIALQPKLWTDTPNLPTSVDVAKRWFVTVAAATGSLVVSLAVEPDFQHLLVKSLSLNHLVMAALVTVASLVLIGPVEEFIYGAGLPGEADAGGPGRFEKLIQTMSWRTSARVILVILLVLLLNVAHSCIAEQLNNRDARTTFIIAITTVTPAVVTYFWCAALQTGQAKLILRVALSAASAGMLLYLPKILWGLLASVGPSNGSRASIWLLVESFLVALPVGFLLVGLPALAGAIVLRADRNRPNASPLRTIGLIAATLAALNTVMVLFLLRVLKTLGLPLEEFKVGELVVPGIASSFGWGGGLLVSGFPDILKRSPTASAPGLAPAAPAPTPTPAS